MIVAAHQPNFFPWLGYFRKVLLADTFVFLDAVQYPRTGGGSWVNRVRILTNGRPVWLTSPVARGASGARIDQVAMADGAWKEKALKTLRLHYGHAPFFHQVYAFLEPMLLREGEGLAEYNIRNIIALAEFIGIEVKWVRQSRMESEDVFQMRGSERLAAICRELGAETYLAGDGADGYEQKEAYARVGIDLEQSGFTTAAYPQRHTAAFVPGLSLLDALFNVGPEGVTNLLKPT